MERPALVLITLDPFPAQRRRGLSCPYQRRLFVDGLADAAAALHEEGLQPSVVAAT
jgi:hypothetical protein